MTALASKLERDKLNVNTHERALVYAALILIAANKNPNNSSLGRSEYQTAVKISTVNSQNSNDGTITSNITIEAKFSYARQTAFNAGGIFIDNVGVFSSFDPSDFLGDPCDALNSDLGEDPNFCTTLEHFFCFHALQWQRALILANSTEVFTRCKILILDEASPDPTLSISLLIPYSYSKYTETRSLLRSVEKLVDAIAFGVSPYLADGVFLTDNYYLTD